MSTHDLTARLSADLRQAMRDRDQPATRAIRRLMAAISNAQAVPQPADLPAQVVNPGNPVVAGRSDVPRVGLTRDDIAQIVAAEIDDLDRAIAEYKSHGQTDRADALHTEKAVLERYRLP